MSWFKEGNRTETEKTDSPESNERKRHNEFVEKYRVPEASDKEKLNVNKKADGNASGGNKDDAPDKGQRIREREQEER